ncbi:inorganic phosphate transporter [Microbacterium halophytorum]|uniref:inorganic phosphate transporter n=1 Tax=Microbacterium halophytorum TaxID=2067568 RepID=UPI000CFBDB75|nr:inorganic phosphate transporter [Microbacterium halophytorum]
MTAQSPTPLVGSESRTEGSDRWWHLGFGLLLAVAFITFTLWSFGWVPDSTNRLILFTAIVFGLFMAFNIGGNDVANSFGTSVGAGTLTMKQALVVAAVFEVSGAVLAGGEVTDTVRSGIVDLDVVAGDPMDFVYIMMAALLGAAVWLLIATRMGWPVSTTHSIIGGIVGAAVTMGFATGTGGWSMVQWGEIGQIAVSWVLSPLLGGTVAFLLYGAIKRYILVYNERADEAIRDIKRERAEHRTRHKEGFERLGEIQQIAYNNAMAQDAAVFRQPDYDRAELETEYYRELADIDDRAARLDSHRALETWVPLLAAGGAIIISSMMLFKGLKNLHLNIDSVGNFLIMGMIGAAVWMAVYIFTKTLRKQALSKATYLLFAWMQVFTASAFAFSHGSNDIANAVGPFAAVLDTLQSGRVGAEAAVPTAVMVAFGVAMLAGLWFIGRKVITTVGKNLTEIHPASGFAAELAAASVVMLASVMGLPVSSTHILIGAVLGVGLVNRAANWKLMRPIGLAWVITLPAAAGIGALGYLGLSLVF